MENSTNPNYQTAWNTLMQSFNIDWEKATKLNHALDILKSHGCDVRLIFND